MVDRTLDERFPAATPQYRNRGRNPGRTPGIKRAEKLQTMLAELGFVTANIERGSAIESVPARRQRAR